MSFLHSGTSTGYRSVILSKSNSLKDGRHATTPRLRGTGRLTPGTTVFQKMVCSGVTTQIRAQTETTVHKPSFLVCKRMVDKVNPSFPLLLAIPIESRSVCRTTSPWSSTLTFQDARLAVSEDWRPPLRRTGGSRPISSPCTVAPQNDRPAPCTTLRRPQVSIPEAYKTGEQT